MHPGGSHSSVGGVILAAGGSRRMGRPKQLLVHEGVSLLRRITEAAVAGGLDPVVVVLGAQAELVAAEVSALPVRTAFNHEWATGIGSSIRCGVRAMEGASVDGVMMLVADQPFATARVVGRIVAAFRATRAPIVACEYGGTVGVPALFDRGYLPRLAELPSDHGAKALIVGAGGAVQRVPFPEGVHDVDTPADYDRLRA